jgi:hypothetical protein
VYLRILKFGKAMLMQGACILRGGCSIGLLSMACCVSCDQT